MSGGPQPLGYTIVEVMIVLAITGVLFLTAVSFTNGKQATTSFHDGVNEFASRVQDMVEQVRDGQYSDIPLNCSFSGSNLTFGASGAQGTNNGCVFLGKIMQLGVGGSSSSYNVYSIAGANTEPPTGVAAGDYTYVYPTAVTNPDLTTINTVPQSLDIACVKVSDAHEATTQNPSSCTSSTVGYGMFGFLQSLGSAGASPGVYQTGTQTSQMVYVSEPTNLDKAGAVSRIAGVTAGLTNVQPATSISICLTDGKRYADVNLGVSDNSQLQVETNMAATSC